MTITAKHGNITEQPADLLALALTTDAFEGKLPIVNTLETLTNGQLLNQAAIQEFEGKAGQVLVLAAPDSIRARFILVLGAGKQSELSITAVREMTGLAVQHATKLGARSVAFELFAEDALIPGDISHAMTEVLQLATYNFAVYKGKQSPNSIEQIAIIVRDSSKVESVTRSIQPALDVAAGTMLARDLVNTPAKDMLPKDLAATAANIAAESNGTIECTILDRAECERRGMNSYLAVAIGADSDPKFIHLSYKPLNPTKRVALVGKGVTFDSGGLSLKPAQYMETMKCDMGGSAAVLGTFKVLQKLQPNVEVHGIIAATENMVNGKAIRPGDIVRASNGKTIEIFNTDAEGRLTLADALVYAQQLKPDVVIDLATLTGAAVVALGEEIAAVYTNDDSTADAVIEASKKVSEEMWKMPLYTKYAKLLESKIADVRNTATSRYGGSTTAALFLQHFIEDGQKWVHIDIAGPAFADRPLNSYTVHGGTGFGVATLVEYLKTV